MLYGDMCNCCSTSPPTPPPSREGSGLWRGMSSFKPGWLCGGSLDNARGGFACVIEDGWAVFDVIPVLKTMGTLRRYVLLLFYKKDDHNNINTVLYLRTTTGLSWSINVWTLILFMAPDCLVIIPFFFSLVSESKRCSTFFLDLIYVLFYSFQF